MCGRNEKYFLTVDGLLEPCPQRNVPFLSGVSRSGSTEVAMADRGTKIDR